MFPFLYSWVKSQGPHSFVDGLRLQLQLRDYPRDVQFKSRLIEGKLYGFGERGVKTKLILETLEFAYAHKEQVSFDSVTIEHVLPQTLTNWWQQHLGEDWQADYELCLHTLGNLTLTAYNSELSNETFPKKKHQLNESHLDLNKYFKDIERWDRESIEKRSGELADMAITIWPYFGEDQGPIIPATMDGVTGKSPKYVTILGERFSVDSWRNVLRKTMETIVDMEPERFTQLSIEYPHFISKDKFSRHHQVSNGYYININLKAKDVYKFCAQAIETIGLSKEDWFVETD